MGCGTYEQHGSKEAVEKPARGADAKGGFMIVPDGVKADGALVYKGGDGPVIEVIAGRSFDPLVDEDGAKYHETRLLVQASGENSYCDRVEGGRRHPHLRIEQQDGDKWRPVDGVPADVRDLVKGASEEADGTLATFKVEQAHQRWHEGETLYKRPDEEKLSQVENEAVDFIDGRKAWGIRDVLTAITFAATEPRVYRVMTEACGEHDPAKDFPRTRQLGATIKVYPSDEFAFVWQYESKIDGVRIGRKGSQFDPAKGSEAIKKGAARLSGSRFDPDYRPEA